MGEERDRAYLRTVTIDDPTKVLPVGSRLSFLPTPVKGVIPHGAATVKNWEFSEGMILNIAFTDSGLHRVEGSGVLVAPGVALCATHVVAPHLTRIMTPGAAFASCWGICTHGLQIWQVRTLAMVPNTDVTILGLELRSALPPENRFFQSVLTTRTPAIGEELTICGYRATEQAFPADEHGVQSCGDMWVCRGVIRERYPLFRDRCMIRWPALAVAVPSRGGLSGGPVYDRDGQLVGLLCSSDDSISYVSMLWPALTARFEASWPAGIYGGTTSLLELDRRLCAIDRPEAITVRYEDSGTVQTDYHEWE